MAATIDNGASVLYGTSLPPRQAGIVDRVEDVAEEGRNSEEALQLVLEQLGKLPADKQREALRRIAALQIEELYADLEDHYKHRDDPAKAAGLHKRERLLLERHWPELLIEAVDRGEFGKTRDPRFAPYEDLREAGSGDVLDLGPAALSLYPYQGHTSEEYASIPFLHKRALESEKGKREASSDHS